MDHQTSEKKPLDASQEIAEGVQVTVTNADMQHGLMMSGQQATRYMVNPNSFEQVPMLVWTEDMDPALKCYIEGCPYVGNSVCFWYNMGTCRKPDGGFGRRFCYNHRFEKSMHFQERRGCCGCKGRPS